MPDIDAVTKDPQRLQALRETGLLDSEIEEQFDRLTRLASRLLGAPATFFSLVDADRDFYKSCVGFSEPLASERQISGVTFCHYSLVSEGALVIPDTKADPIYAAVPTVTTLGVAAYLGVPVRDPSGHVLGSFCAIDFKPHDWSALEVDTMKELAKSAEREVAIRHWMREQQLMMDRERNARLDLEKMMDSRARLMRGFTHDVKNPLGAADGFLTLMQEEIMGAMTEPQHDSITRIRGSIQTALGLIDELIEIARAESHELDTDSEPVDLARVMDDLASEYRAQAEAQGLTISATAPETLPDLESDDSRIRQILSNLISNAVKYTRHGSIAIEARFEPECNALGGKPCIGVAVRDTGVGISQENMHMLFDEFTRFSPEQSEGAGLGLAISQRVASALGGIILVDSTPDHGSTFTLMLPASGQPFTQQNAASS